MVVVSVLGILVAVALPSMQRFIVSARVNSIASDFITSIMYARSEAVARSGRVVVCARKALVNNTCTTSRFWGELGWIVFVDNDYNNAMGPGDELLRVYDPVDATGGAYRLIDSGKSSFVRFNADGTTGQAGGKFDITVGLRGGNWPERTVCIAITGRPRTIDYTGSSSCT